MNIEEVHKPTTTDEDLWKFVEEHWSHPSSSLVTTALTELSLRSERATRESITHLERSIESFDNASEKYSRIIVCLTWILIFLTAVLAIPEMRSAFPYLSHALGRLGHVPS